jgi:hypothetical protein
MEVELHQGGASFEASLREAPQDEDLIQSHQRITFMVRSGAAKPGRVSNHAQRRCKAILASLDAGYFSCGDSMPVAIERH